MPEKFVPFTQRAKREDPFGLVAGAPPFLRNLLEPAVSSCFYARSDGYRIRAGRAPLLNRMILELRLPISHDDDYERYRRLCSLLRDEDTFFNVIDYLLHEEALPADFVEEVLDLGGSELTVTNSRLTLRVDSTLSELRDDILSDDTKASEHLSKAWEKAFGMNQDAHAAWMAANHAIEVLLKPVTLPKSAQFTISKAANAIEEKPSKWEFELCGQAKGTGLEVFISLLRMMFPEPAHHGGNGEDGPSIDEARAAVTLATTIVQWLRSGAFRFREGQL